MFQRLIFIYCILIICVQVSEVVQQLIQLKLKLVTFVTDTAHETDLFLLPASLTREFPASPKLSVSHYWLDRKINVTLFAVNSKMVFSCSTSISTKVFCSMFALMLFLYNLTVHANTSVHEGNEQIKCLPHTPQSVLKTSYWLLLHVTQYFYGSIQNVKCVRIRVNKLFKTRIFFFLKI